MFRMYDKIAPSKEVRNKNSEYHTMLIYRKLINKECNYMKKRIMGAVIVIITLFLIYVLSWIAFFNFSVKPHIIPENGIVLAEERYLETYSDLYLPDDSVEYQNKPHDVYSFYAPRFLYFNCYVTYGSEQDFNSKTGKITNPSGSEFDYSMTAHVNLSGKIDRYSFVISPLVNNDNYDELCSVEIDGNGNLLNKESLSQNALNIYNDAESEIAEITDTLNHLYNF